MTKRIIKTVLTIAETAGIFGLSVIIGSGIFGGDVQTLIVGFFAAAFFAAWKMGKNETEEK